ncbi:hypothetical protein BLOT_006808 [Blomia tropicalis]|nr:hypothetical protein BLOT_006808 [Blomia tropicalis]
MSQEQSQEYLNKEMGTMKIHYFHSLTSPSSTGRLNYSPKMNKQRFRIERLKTDNSRLIQLLAQNNSKMENTNRTYAGALKKTTTEHIVQIYPKQHKVNSPEATKQLLKTKIPLLDSICVDSIKKSKSNGVTVKCRNAADAAKLCQTAEVNGFEANVPEKRNQVCTLLIRGRDINEDIAENIIRKIHIYPTTNKS